MKTLVIGGSGLLGTNLVNLCEATGHDVIGTYHSTKTETGTEKLDKGDAGELEKLVLKTEPDLVVDTAAFHAVDDCETERARAWDVNAQGTRNAAAAADTVDAHYVFISTDYVFPGEPNETPYRELDRVDPLNYYARTKYAGEQAARIVDDWTVLRGSVIYGLASENFLTWALGELEADEEVGIVDDQVSRPTYAPDLAKACLEVGERNLTGLYHATGPESLSRYDFTTLLAETLDLDSTLVSPITTEELGQEAPRPRDGSLDSSRLYEAIDYKFRRPAIAFDEIAQA